MMTRSQLLERRWQKAFLGGAFNVLFYFILFLGCAFCLERLAVLP